MNILLNKREFSNNQKALYGWLLFAVCFFSLFLFLGSTIFNTRGEPREAVVALSMIHEGNWVLPINNGVDMAYKPPFFHWLAALCSLLTGGVSEYATRMPSALALTAMVMVGYAFYARRRNASVALLMGLITLTSFEVHRAGVACRVDMVLTCMMVLALYRLYRWVEADLKGVPWLATLFLSGAFLSKGPVGLALPCLVVAVFAWMRVKGFWRVTWRMAGVGLLALVLPAVWYVAAYGQGGERFLHLVYEENVLRLLGKMTYESHINPWTYNVMTIVSGFLPYTLLVLFSLFILPYKRLSSLRPSLRWWNRLTGGLRRMDDVQLFTLLSFLIIFVFYCIPKSKRSVYLLPVYPFLAYFLAEYILWLCRNHRKVVHAFAGVISGLAVVMTLTFIALRLGLVPDAVVGHGRHAAQNLAMLHALSATPLHPLQWLAIAVPLAGIAFLWTHRQTLALSTTLLVATVFFALDGVYQPLALNVKSDKPVADYIASLQPSGRIYSFRTDVVEGNPMHPFTVNYYLGDRVAPFEAFKPSQGLLIVSNNDIDAFCRRHPDYRVTLVRDFHHVSCDDRKPITLYSFQRLPL